MLTKSGFVYSVLRRRYCRAQLGEITSIACSVWLGHGDVRSRNEWIGIIGNEIKTRYCTGDRISDNPSIGITKGIRVRRYGSTNDMFLECTGGHYSDPDLPGDHWSNCSIMSGVFPNRRVIRLRSDDAMRSILASSETPEKREKDSGKVPWRTGIVPEQSERCFGERGIK